MGIWLKEDSKTELYNFPLEDLDDLDGIMREMDNILQINMEEVKKFFTN